ncbi:MAG TPA: preprotein translocase subunit YajC [Gaiellaceae bacterium]|nr:preprotein translocase subunit YajC [Gaiellaceae bacterium]
MQFLIIMALMLGVMYVLMIRPQRQKQAQQQDMIANAGVGDDVLTTGGIYATITEVEGDDVAVEIAEGVTVHMTRRGIAAVLPPEQEEDEEVEEDDAEALADELATEASADGDEAAVTDGEEAVRAGAAEVSTGDDRR